ncbi:MAG: hypothetical protein U0T81_00910 [Saprospiraceae bacterium]
MFVKNEIYNKKMKAAISAIELASPAPAIPIGLNPNFPKTKQNIE